VPVSLDEETITDAQFLRELVAFGFQYAKLNPNSLANATENGIEAFLGTFWQNSVKDSTAMRQATGKLDDLFTGLETKEERLKLLKFETNLLRAIGQSGQELLEEKQDSKFLSALVQLGGAYAALNPNETIAGEEPLNFFLDTLWNAQNETDVLTGTQQISDFLKDSSVAHKLISFSQHLLELASQSESPDKHDTTFLKNVFEFGKAYSLIDPLNLFGPSGSLDPKQLDPNEWLDVSPEAARNLLRSARITGGLTGFANDLLQYALDSADTAPWGTHPNRTDRTKIAPPLEFDTSSEFSQAIVQSNQFREEMRRAIEGDVKASAVQDLPVGENLSLPRSGQNVPLNYRDDRERLETPRLSISIGYAEVETYSGEASVEKTTSTTAQYEAQVSGTVQDLYDFNNPKDEAVREADPFSWLARLAFIAQSGGTLAIFEYTVDVEATFQGGVLLSANPR
jgi:hypothetical protein